MKESESEFTVTIRVKVSVYLFNYDRSNFVKLFINFYFLGLSKFAKLARSVTRSRQFSAHLPTLKDSTKQSNLAHVSTCF